MELRILLSVFLCLVGVAPRTFAQAVLNEAAETDIRVLRDPVTTILAPAPTETFFIETSATTLRVAISACQDSDDFPLTTTFAKGSLTDFELTGVEPSRPVTTSTTLQRFVIDASQPPNPSLTQGVFISVENTPDLIPLEIRFGQDTDLIRPYSFNALRIAQNGTSGVTLVTTNFPETLTGGDLDIYLDRSTRPIDTPSLCLLTSKFQKGNVVSMKTNETSPGSSQYSIELASLRPGSSYVAYLVYREPETGSVSMFPGYQFQTSGGAARATALASCERVSGLAFCNKVDYDTPIAAGQTMRESARGRDEIANRFLSNMTAILNQYNCDMNSFSIVRDCDDCYDAYKDWVCSWLFPRCVDENFDPLPGLNFTQNELPFEGFSVTENVVYRTDFGVRVAGEDSRLFLGVDPFFQVLPCVDVCYNVVRSCPSTFEFTCPFRMLHRPVYTMAPDYGLAPGCLDFGRNVSIVRSQKSDLAGLDAPIRMRSQSQSGSVRSARQALGSPVLVLLHMINCIMYVIV